MKKTGQRICSGFDLVINRPTCFQYDTISKTVFQSFQRLHLKNSKLPSERSFGLLSLSVSLGFGLFGLYKEWAAYSVIAFFSGSLILGFATLFFPGVLVPFNKAWFFLGQALGKVVSPIVLGVIYFGLLTPVAVIGRIFGRDELKIKPRPQVSYWVKRDPPGPTASSFKNQF